MIALGIIIAVFSAASTFAQTVDPVAVHEAARAIVHEVANFDGANLVQLTIRAPRPELSNTAYIQYSGGRLSEDEFHNPQDLVRYSAYLQSGVVAREMILGHLVTNDPAKLQDIRDEVDRLGRKFSTNNFLRQGAIVARDQLMSNWHLFAATRDFLIENGSISNDAFQALVREAKKLQPRMNALLRRGWTVQEAEKIKIDLAPIKLIHEDCQKRFEQRGSSITGVVL